MPTSPPLTASERKRLARLENVVLQGIGTFIEVGAALAEIRDRRLYRETHSTFEKYCRDSWGFSRQRGNQYIAAAEVTTVVVNAGLPAPETERDARALVPIIRELREQYPDGNIEPERVREVMEAQLQADARTRAFLASGSNEWYTPSTVIEAARTVLGGIDLDPASSAEANKTVKAKRYFTEADDGLSKEWKGRVWMNPPYGVRPDGSQAGKFAAKLIREHDAGNVTAAIALLNAHRMEARWFKPLYDYPLVIANGRIRFRNPDRAVSDAPSTGVVFVYLGRDFDGFIEVFKRFGYVMKDPTARAWQKRFSARPPWL